MDILSFSFIVITFFTLTALSYATNNNKTIIGLYLVFGVVISIPSYFGFFENTNTLPPRFILIFLPATLLTIYSYRILRTTTVNISWIIAIHIIRIAVELILYGLYLDGEIPKLMTFAGSNWDILSGITAIPILLLYRCKRLPKTLFIIWNWFAIALLLIIVISAILSAPFPFQRFAFEQPDVGVLKFPYTLLPSVIVPIVFLSHACLLRSSKTIHLQ